MHRLEITGATPEELYFNSVKMLSVLLKGAGLTQPVDLLQQSEPPRSEPLADEKTTVLPPKAKRGTKVKATELNDDISDVGKTIEHEPSKLTLDGDIRPRLRAIQKAHTERGNDMPTCVSYIQRLYGPFGITKADQLKVEQFAEFMEASEAYLNGEA